MPSTQTDRIDGLTTSVAVKAPCRVATSSNTALVTLQTINGVTLLDGDRVLVAAQTSSVDNGIYVAHATAWTRARDWDGARDAVPGTLVVVRGTGNDVLYKAVCNDNPILIGTSGVTFALAAFSDSSTISFLQAGTGALARTSQDKMRERISPEDFGCVGDGVTDDTNNFQKALTYLGTLSAGLLKGSSGKTYLISGVNVSAHTTIDLHGCTVKQKVLGALVGTSIFTIKGNGVRIFGGTLNGQRASQPADGFSDSFKGGGSGKGRGYRAGILADSTVTAVQDLVVRGVEFTLLYGACVACLDVSFVAIEDCYAHDTNFELGYCQKSAGSPSDLSIQRNTLYNIGTGDASVNADCTAASQYDRVIFMGNHGTNCERCLIKGESSKELIISNNVYMNNTKDNFFGIQVDGSTTAARVIISNNVLSGVGGGVILSSGVYDKVTVIGNTIDTTTGSTVADGVSLTANGVTSTSVYISNNHLYNIKRHGINISGTLSALTIVGNVVIGQGNAGTYALLGAPSGGNFISSTVVRHNLFSTFEASAVGAGMVFFNRAAAEVINNFCFQGNTILTGGAGNRALRTSGVDLFVNGIVSDNYIDGQLELYSASLRYRDNTVTGTITLPAGTANVETKGATQATVGAAGAASALPGAPTGYEIRVVNGTERAVPFWPKS